MSSEQQQQVTTTSLLKMKQAGEKIVVLTAYDASFTRQLEAAGVEVVLIGDSLGMVVQGRDSTLATTVDDMVYHGACVARGGQTALRVIDMPFMSYRCIDVALDNAARLMAEGGAHMVKLEGGEIVLDIVTELTVRGVPVCAHLGLLPQSVHQLGGYRVQGRHHHDAERILHDALALEKAGASMLVVECIPSVLAAEICRQLTIPVIGIGAGPDCDGQVLVLYDMLGITPGKRPKFSKDFLAEAGNLEAALSAYVTAVKAGDFPAAEHGFS